jgi:hypothetical protein
MVGRSRKVFANKNEIECYRCNQMGHYARDCQQEQGPLNRRRFQGQVKLERMNKSSGHTAEPDREKPIFASGFTP